VASAFNFGGGVGGAASRWRRSAAWKWVRRGLAVAAEAGAGLDGCGGVGAHRWRRRQSLVLAAVAELGTLGGVGARRFLRRRGSAVAAGRGLTVAAERDVAVESGARIGR